MASRSCLGLIMAQHLPAILLKFLMKNLVSTHQKTTPLWPKANAEAEQFIHTLGKTIRTAQAEQKDWQSAVITLH